MRYHLLFLFISFLSITYAQETPLDAVSTTKIKSEILNSEKNSTVIWSEDFGNGFPNDWSRGTINTSGGVATCNWVWSNDGSWGYWNGNSGNSADSAIQSTTSNNGFLISDIDSANHYAYGQPSGSTYEYIDSYFITSSINTLGYPNISLEFEQNFRFNNGIDLIVSISSDSISWTDFFVQGNASNNQESPNPELASLNISCVAGDQPNVYIKIGWTARVYYWMIDDMRIVETLNHDLDILETNYGGWYTTPIADGFGLEYTLTPILQATANPYTFEGIVTNNGGYDEITKLNVEVFNNIGVSVFSTTSSDSTILSQDVNCNMDTVTFVANSKFTPTSMGNYYFNTWASSPDTITSIMYDEVIVTDSIYARDVDSDYSEYGLGRSCGGMIIGTYFDIYATDEITSISVFIKDNSVVGSDIYVALYEIDANNSKLLLSQSDDYTLQTNDLGNWVTITLTNSYNAIPGSYMAAIGGYQHPLDTTIIGMSQYTWPATCYIQKNGCLNSGQTYGNWYWVSRVPMIRINVGELNSSSIDNNFYNNLVSVFPNPSTGVFTLESSEILNEYFTVDIVNIVGQKVYSLQKNINGYLDEDINLSSFDQGTYFIHFINSNTSVIKKIIIE